jgi:hypothetical protein
MKQENRNRIKAIAFKVSIVLNIIFGFLFFINWFNSPPNRVGVLTRDLKIGMFGGKKAFFVLPKGLTVRDASPQGIASAGLFEPYRFSIVITSNDNTLVNYQVKKKDLFVFNEIYSSELEDKGKTYFDKHGKKTDL